MPHDSILAEAEVDDFVEEPVDQNELVERLFERDVHEVHRHSLVAERLVEQDVDA